MGTKGLLVLLLCLMTVTLIFSQGFSTRGFPKELKGKDTLYSLTYPQLMVSLWYCYMYQEDTAKITNLTKQVEKKDSTVSDKTRLYSDQVKLSNFYQTQAITCNNAYNVLNTNYNTQVRKNKTAGIIEKASIAGNVLFVILLVLLK